MPNGSILPRSSTIGVGTARVAIGPREGDDRARARRHGTSSRGTTAPVARESASSPVDLRYGNRRSVLLAPQPSLVNRRRPAYAMRALRRAQRGVGRARRGFFQRPAVPAPSSSWVSTAAAGDGCGIPPEVCADGQRDPRRRLVHQRGHVGHRRGGCRTHRRAAGDPADDGAGTAGREALGEARPLHAERALGQAGRRSARGGSAGLGCRAASTSQVCRASAVVPRPLLRRRALDLHLARKAGARSPCCPLLPALVFALACSGPLVCQAGGRQV